MFHVIRNIGYLKYIQFWKGVGSDKHSFKWYTIAQSSKISRKRPCIYTIVHHFVIFMNKPPNLSEYFNTDIVDFYILFGSEVIEDLKRHLTFLAADTKLNLQLFI